MRVLPRRPSSRTSLVAPAWLAGAGLMLAACAGADPAAEDPTPDATSESEEVSDVEPIQVLASFYALQYAVEQVGGDLVEVSSLTPPGVEPHDLELSPRMLRTIDDVDAVVYLSGFQPAVDDGVAARQPERVLDVLEAADLREAGEHAHHDHSGEHADEHGHDEHGHDEHGHDEHGHDEHGHDGHGHDDHADEHHGEDADEHHGEDAAAHVDDHGHDHGGLDPHFWLDPMRLAAVGHEIARLLAETAPEHADAFTEGAEAFEADLTDLDEQYATGLAECERDVVITGHAAFGYLADRYGFTEIGIAGIDPDTEPSPARLRQIREVIDEYGVTRVYTEDPANPAVAQVLADDLGVEVGVLDPVEVQADGTDYRGVMESNLDELREGLGCG
jgi:zinc transport system substrate-binding protein